MLVAGQELALYLIQEAEGEHGGVTLLYQSQERLVQRGDETGHQGKYSHNNLRYFNEAKYHTITAYNIGMDYLFMKYLKGHRLE